MLRIRSLYISVPEGKGLAAAEKDRESWHWCTPFGMANGKPVAAVEEEDYSSVTASFLLERMKEDKRWSPSPPHARRFRFTPEKRREAGSQFVDVGIAEETAVALASGIAVNGGKRSTAFTAPLCSGRLTSFRKICASTIARLPSSSMRRLFMA